MLKGNFLGLPLPLLRGVEHGALPTLTCLKPIVPGFPARIYSLTSSIGPSSALTLRWFLTRVTYQLAMLSHDWEISRILNSVMHGPIDHSSSLTLCENGQSTSSGLPKSCWGSTATSALEQRPSTGLSKLMLSIWTTTRTRAHCISSIVLSSKRRTFVSAESTGRQAVSAKIFSQSWASRGRIVDGLL